MFDKLKFIGLLGVSLFYFNIFYEIDYYLVKSFIHLMRNKMI